MEDIHSFSSLDILRSIDYLLFLAGNKRTYVGRVGRDFLGEESCQGFVEIEKGGCGGKWRVCCSGRDNEESSAHLIANTNVI